MKKDYIKTLKITKKAGSEVLVEGEIPAEVLGNAHDALYKKTLSTLEVPGFRAGKAPEHLAKNHINTNVLLDHAAEEVFRNEYPEIVNHHELFPIDHPRIEITKLALGNPLGFKITIPVMPTIELPDYKKIARGENKKEIKTEEVTEKDIDKAVEDVRKMYAHEEYHKNNPKDTEHNHAESLPLPEITDEFVKKLGDFKDVADFRAKLKEGIAKEFVMRNKEKRRIAIIEAVVKDFSIDLPSVLVESEIDRMMSELHNRISSAGITPAQYFEQSEKKEADLRKEWLPSAEKRVKTDIILAEIAKKESLKPDPKEVETETARLIAHYKDTDKTKARNYVEHMLTNDKVFEFLENLK